MRKIFMAGILLCAFSCQPVKTIPGNAGKVTITRGCQANVTCNAEVHQATALQRFENEDGTLDYKLVENKNTTVFKLSYERDIPKNVQDGQYREELVVEVPNTGMPINVSLDASSKAVFGRFCYCKGSTGYYPVESGQFDLYMQDGQLNGHVSFLVTKVPQAWKEAFFLVQ